MYNSQQLIKKDKSQVFPKTFLDAIRSRETGVSLEEIIKGFNMYFVSYTGNTSQTRNQVPMELRKKGLWLTYINFKNEVVTEWYDAIDINNEAWGYDKNWRIASNRLVGDISISANGNWVVNGKELDTKAKGDKGDTPLLRYNNLTLEASYNNGKKWEELTKFENKLLIQGYVATIEELPKNAVQGDIWMVGPTYDESDLTHDQPHYRMWVKQSSGWVDNGEFTNAGPVNTNNIIDGAVTIDKLTPNLQSLIIYDVSALNDGAVFESLSALLSSSNLSTLIPTSVRHGGMSIRFIQGYVPNSDNKYVQYRLMADEFTTDITQWVIADEGAYVDNPEFVYVKTDNENKILWAIRTDGSIYYGAGVPQQIVDYINKKIAELSLDEYESIVTFLSDYLEGDTTLKAIIGEWNNAVSGKKVSIIGDSISTFNQEGYKIDGYNMYYPTSVGDRGADVTTVNDTWWMQVINSVAGTLEVNASFSGSTASSSIIGFSPRVPLLGNPDIIYVALGTNDSGKGVTVGEINFEAETYDLTQFAPAYIKGMQDTIAAYPKAKIVCVAFDMDIDYQNAIKTIAEHYGAEYIYVGDISVVHPNKAEMTASANRIIPSAKYTITDAIKTLSCGKADKETGKSLIDADYASSCSTIENPEYLQITTDSDDRILEEIQADGTKVIGGDIRVLGNMEVSGVSYKVIENPEYLIAWVDVENKVIFGLKTDGNTYIGDADFLNDIKNNQGAINEIKSYLTNFDTLDIDTLSSIITVDNPEYIEAKTDSAGKILAGRTHDGTAFENVGFSTPKVSIDGHTIENIEYSEGRSEITTDGEGKIISYRDSSGVKHEEVGIETDSVNTNHLNLTVNGMSEFQQALKDSGFQPGGAGDFSDAIELHIPEPYCARINFTGIDSMPQTKTTNAHAYMEFYDMLGNYFKKEVIMNAQGRSTMAHPKKNIAIDICNNNGWNDDDTFSLQIGDWVPQDSFHLKAYYNDPFRCLCPVAYRLNDEILKTRGEHNDYVWKRALLNLDNITPTSTGYDTAKDAIDGWNTNARCFPMGFPCIVYLNGDFYGIYSWQLKKHRDNYQMSKKKTKHIHLDGIISLDRILNANGDTTKIWWTTDSPEGIEIRNPKPKKKKDGWDLVLLNGEKYDADANGGEIMSPTMIVEGEEIANPNWNPDDTSHVKSYEVKQYILNMSKIIPTLASAYNTYEESAKTSEDKAAFKKVFEPYFDVDNLIDYLILSDVLANYDGFSQNVQWITYNGVKWYLCVYDMDGVMGNWWQLTDKIVEPKDTHYNYAQFQYLPIFYENELNARYKELRDKGIIDANHIYSLVENWLKRVGAKETFDKEWEKWSGFIKNDNVHRLYKWLQISISNMDILYNYNQN